MNTHWPWLEYLNHEIDKQSQTFIIILYWSVLNMPARDVNVVSYIGDRSFCKTSNLSKAHVRRDSSGPATLAISVGQER